jgi:hypothetical protein
MTRKGNLSDHGRLEFLSFAPLLAHALRAGLPRNAFVHVVHIEFQALTPFENMSPGSEQPSSEQAPPTSATYCP